MNFIQNLDQGQVFFSVYGTFLLAVVKNNKCLVDDKNYLPLYFPLNSRKSSLLFQCSCRIRYSVFIKVCKIKNIIKFCKFQLIRKVIMLKIITLHNHIKCINMLLKMKQHNHHFEYLAYSVCYVIDCGINVLSYLLNYTFCIPNV